MRVPFKNGAIDSKASPDEVVQVAYAEDAAYGLSVDGRLRRWEVAAGTLRQLPGPRVSRLAPDGSVAASTSWSGEKVATIEIRELPSGRTIAAQRFEHGASVMAVSRSLAVLTVGLPVDPERAVMQVPPPTEEPALWDLSAGQISRWWPDDECRQGAAELSADGARVLCGAGQGRMAVVYDRSSGRALYAPPLAPDWTAPVRAPVRQGREGASEDDQAGGDDEDDPVAGDPDAAQRRHCPKCSVRYPPPTTWVVSTLLGPDGSVYVTYRGYEQPRQWRLERWIPDATEANGGRLERLGIQMTDLSGEVLAASPDGAAVVTGGRGRPTTVWRGPRFAAERLPASSANAAAFSPDGRRLVTGHGSGLMFVWDAATLRQLAASR
jgi:WD40 repeat protein